MITLLNEDRWCPISCLHFNVMLKLRLSAMQFHWYQSSLLLHRCEDTPATVCLEFPPLDHISLNKKLKLVQLRLKFNIRRQNKQHDINQIQYSGFSR